MSTDGEYSVTETDDGLTLKLDGETHHLAPQAAADLSSKLAVHAHHHVDPEPPEGAHTVIASKYRRGVLDALAAGPQTPAEMLDKTEVTEELSRISRALSELRETDIVELAVPEDAKKGRLYRLTGRGRAIANWLATRKEGGEP